MEPVQIKAACQPQRAVTAAMRMGAMKAEALEPELKRPVARARSSEGNHSVVALMAAGKLPDSPRPRRARQIMKPTTIETRNPAHEIEVEERLDEREDRAVHVVDGGSEEEKTADGPSNI